MSRFFRCSITLILSLMLIVCASTFPTQAKDLHLEENDDSASPNFPSSAHLPNKREFRQQQFEELQSAAPQRHTEPKEKLSSPEPSFRGHIAEPTTHTMAELKQKSYMDSDEKDHHERLEKPMSEQDWQEDLSERNLELDEGNELCAKRPIVNSKHYEEFVPGHGWLKRLCAFGTIYNSDTCSCSDMDIPKGNVYPFKRTKAEKEEDNEMDSQSVELAGSQNNSRPSEANRQNWLTRPPKLFISEETNPDNEHDSIEKVKSIENDSIAISSSEGRRSSIETIDRIQEIEDQKEGVDFDRDTASESRGVSEDSSEGNDTRPYVEKDERHMQSERNEKVSPEGEKVEVTDKSRLSVDSKQRWRKPAADFDRDSIETLGESVQQDDVSDSQEKTKPEFDEKEKNRTCFLGLEDSDEAVDKDSVGQMRKWNENPRSKYSNSIDDSHDENSLKEESQTNAQLKGMSAEIDRDQSFAWDEESQEGVMSSSHEEADLKTSVSVDGSDSTENDMKTRPIAKKEFRRFIRYFRQNFIEMFRRFITEWITTMTRKYEE